MAVERKTVDLAGYQDLVMILLGMQVRTMAGLKTLFGMGPKITKAAAEQPDGLLHHESFLWTLKPVQLGIRQYWRDFDALERWARSEPHRQWWKNFLRDSGGTGFWHETYFRRGGVEVIYDDLAKPIGMLCFAPVVPAKGAMFGARQRAHMPGGSTVETPVKESELYKGSDE